MKTRSITIALLCALAFAFSNVQAQSTNLTEIIIGEGTESVCDLPFNTCSGGWAYTESIYPEEAIDGPCYIHSISYYCQEPPILYGEVLPLMTRAIDLYIGVSTKSAYLTNTDWTSSENLNNCLHNLSGFELSISFGIEIDQGWITLNLDQPYYYEGGNLIVGLAFYSSNGNPMMRNGKDGNDYSPLIIACTETDNNSTLFIHNDDMWNLDFNYPPDSGSEGTLFTIRPNIKLGTVSGPNLVSVPDSIDFGIRPSGCWMEPYNALLINNGESAAITAISNTNDFFIPCNMQLPLEFPELSVIPYSISTGIGEGSQTDVITFTYGDNKTTEAILSATAYIPTNPDVWEMAREVTAFPIIDTITDEMAVFDNYQLPGKNADGKDVVYKMTFDQNMVFNASVIDGNDGKQALYNEGFEGHGGPSQNNHIWSQYDIQCDFENGFGDIDWQTTPDCPWIITSTNPYQGSYCMRSDNNGLEVSTSTMSLTIEVPTNATISFYAKICISSGSYSFSLDGQSKIQGGLYWQDWMKYEYEIEAGSHTLIWTCYTRNNDSFFYVDDFSCRVGTGSLNINNCELEPGTYYLVASSTSDQFIVNISPIIMPLPVVAEECYPHNTSNHYGNNSITLSWHLGQYTREYQLLFGETNPPTDTLIHWTNELEESFSTEIDGFKTYYWCVNERNANGVTNSPVWQFTTYQGINPSADNIIYVTPTGAGIKNGSSWENAASNIQVAIDSAIATPDNIATIWVAKGNYYEWHGIIQYYNDADYCFNADNGVKIYGGFNGNEPPDYDLSLRDLDDGATILDAQSTCNVARAINGCEWDGFVFQNGKDACVRIGYGGALLRNCKIISGINDGIKIYNTLDFQVEISDCVISNNARYGVLQEFSFNVNFYDCEISNNPNIGVYGNCNLVRCRLCNNGRAAIMRESTLVVPIGGGSVERIGGSLVNCLVANNNDGTNFNYIYNSTIVNNGGGGIAYPSYGGYDLYLSNSIIWGNSTQINDYWSFHQTIYTFNNNAIQGGLESTDFRTINLASPTDSIGLQPGFVQPSEGIGIEYSDGDWSLSSLSPCINIGSENELNSTLLESDLVGNIRVQQGCIDLGAYESEYTALAWDTIMVTHCEGEPYLEHGFNLPGMEAGDYVFEGIENNGELSIITMNLHINPKTYDTLYLTTDGYLELNGYAYTEPGIYTQILPNQYGCDSVLTLYIVPEGYIDFACSNVKSICVANWDTNNDGELSYYEAAVVKDLGNVFHSKFVDSTSFEELQFFIGLRSISQGAFAYCGGLTSVMISNYVTSIGVEAFFGCSDLTFIGIPNNLVSIGSYAFAWCHGLTSIEIPSSVISIGESIFEGCSNLNQIIVDEANLAYDSRENCNAIIETITNKLIAGCNSTRIPSSISTIGPRSFNGCYALTTLNLPVALNEIGALAFSGCSSIQSIIVEAETPPLLGEYAFIGVSTGIPVYVPCGSEEAYNTVSWGGFSDFREVCPGLITVVADPMEGGTVSGDGSYNGGATCTVSASPNEGYFFKYWTENGTIVSYAVDYSFIVLNDRNLVANFGEDGIIVFTDENVKNVCIDRWDTNGDGELSYGEAAAVTSLDNAFSYNGSIATFDELEHFIKLASINGYEFAYCTSLSSIAIPNSVVSIGWGAFEGCYGLESIEIPSSVTSVSAAFISCSNLLEIVVDPDNEVYDSRDNCNAIVATATNTLVVGCAGTVIPGTVTAIGENAFYGCGNLTSIVIPNAVSNIGHSAFVYCGGLAHIIIHGEMPPALEWGVFDGVNQGIPVYVPCGSEEAYNTVSWGGFSDFREMCPGVITVVADPMEGGTVSGGGSYDGGATCTVSANPNEGYFFKSWTESGTIVSTDADYTFIVASDRNLVANFGEDGIIVFADENVKNVCVDRWDTNGDGELSYSEAAAVTSLDNAFSYNGSIATFDELEHFINLASINGYEFAYCTSLSSIAIPNSVASIGWGAFEGCYGLESIEIPSSVTSISTAFKNCSNLLEIVVDPDNEVYDSRDNCNAIVATATNTLVVGCAGTVIPGTVTAIGGNAFYGYGNLTSIEIPDAVSNIGNYAFAYCGGLAQIIVHRETPPDLEWGVFEGINSSIPVYVPCGSEEAYNTVSWGGFSDFREMCPGVITVVADPMEGGTVSGGGSYDGGATCTVSANPNEGYFFKSWTESGTIVSTDADYTFIVANDRNLVANFGEDGIIVFADENVKNVCVDRWDTNGDGELSYSEAAAVTSLDGAFSWNSEITSFDELQYFIRLTAINEYEFAYSSLLTIVIPNTVISINSYAFLSCSILASIVIPNSVASIGGYAFEGCSNLLEIVVDPGNEVYDSRENCNAIVATATNTLVVGCAGTVIPSTVTAVGENAFYGCGNLTSIEIPDAVSNIGNYAFAYCGGLAQIIVHGEMPPGLGWGAFEGINSSIPVYVPCGSEEAYNSVSWGGFSDFREMCPGVITVVADPMEGGTVSGGGSYDGGATCMVSANPNEGYFFKYWTEDGTVVSTDADYTFIVASDRNLVANFEEDGIIVFADENVKNVCVDRWDTNCDGELSHSEAAAVTSLDNAFNYNGSIATFDELEHFINLASINGYEFAYCTSLSSIAIPNSVVSIGWGAFEGCHGLESIEIPSSVTSVSMAFGFCSNLLEIVVDPGNEVYDSRDNCNAIVATATNTLVVGCAGTVIPGTVTAIGENAFYGCGNLTSIVIPDAVSNIGNYAFAYCGGLAHIIVRGETPPALEWGVFEGVNQGIPVYVPCGSGEAYNSVSWGGFSDFREVCPGVITVVADPMEGGTVSGGGSYDGGATCTVSANPNEGYFFINWTKEGEVVSTDEYHSFMVTGDATFVANFVLGTNSQTTFAQGWNWWSPIFETSIEAIQADLGDNLLQIRAKNGPVSGVVVPGEMYKIETNGVCTLSILGIPITTCSVTINPGENWFGFVGTAKTVEIAFTNFSASEGDKVISQDGGFAVYENGAWSGTLTMLVPGKGYVYISNDTEQKTLVIGQ